MLSPWFTPPLLDAGKPYNEADWSSGVATTPAILCHKEPTRSKQNTPSRGLWMPELVLYGIRLLAQASLGKLSTNESAVM